MQLQEALWGYGHKTDVADTRVKYGTDSKRGKYTYLKKVVTTTAATAHTLTAMRSQGRTTLSAAAAAAQAVVVITADPGLANGDDVAIQKPDGTWFHTTVASFSGTNVTLTDNVPTGALLSGARFLWYGDPTDSVHDDFEFRTPASQTQWPNGDDDGILMGAATIDEPLVLSYDNITNAGHVEWVNGFFSRAST